MNYTITRVLTKHLAVAAVVALPLLAIAKPQADEPWKLVTTAQDSAPTARHESGVAEVNDRIYLIGGRDSRPVEAYNPLTRSWENLGPAPLELHHFQPVTLGSKIYIVGAFTCCYPVETIIAAVHVFDTATKSWTTDGSLPSARLRGGAAAVARNGKIYVLGGNTNGHSGGAVAWFDEFDPATGQWTVLPDAPHARDHFAAVIVNNKLVAAAGRQTAQPNPFANPVTATDVYDFANGQWTSVQPIPTARAGAVAVAVETEVIVAGGEISTTSTALDTVEAFDVTTNTWRSLQPMNFGRHSGGGVVAGTNLHMIAGSLTTGGGSETTTQETLALNTTVNTDRDDDGLSNSDEIAVYGTNPDDADSDDDTLSDGEEVERGTDPLNNDSDDDGVTDSDEINLHGSNPLNADSDGDDLLDGAELNLHGSDPLNADSDADELMDGAEVNLHGTNPLLADTDMDGLDDAEEINTHQTDPLSADSDEDGLADGEEVAVGTDPLQIDSDNDGLTDASEVKTYGTDPLSADSDQDSLTDNVEIILHGTNPLQSDTDEDGLDDAAEVNGVTDPLDADSDDDTLLDGAEIAAGTDPVNADTDADGVPDAEDDDPLHAPKKRSGSAGWLLITALGATCASRRNRFVSRT